MRTYRTILIFLLLLVFMVCASLQVSAKDDSQWPENHFVVEITNTDLANDTGNQDITDNPSDKNTEIDINGIETSQTVDIPQTMPQETQSYAETSMPVASSSDSTIISTIQTNETTTGEPGSDAEQYSSGVVIQILKTSKNGEKTVITISGLKIVILIIFGLIIAALLFTTTLLVVIRIFRKSSQNTPATSISASNKAEAPMTDANVITTPAPTLENGEADPEQFYLQLDSRVIQEEELYRFSRVQLQYIINSLYAMQGRSFKKQELFDYYNSKTWYHSKSLTDEEAEASMNDIMSKNLGILVQYRAKKGWNK